jgi:DNA-binding response OmpR family regulator
VRGACAVWSAVTAVTAFLRPQPLVTQAKIALEEGADSFMGKPFRLPDVVERVQSMLRTQGA